MGLICRDLWRLEAVYNAPPLLESAQSPGIPIQELPSKFVGGSYLKISQIENLTHPCFLRVLENEHGRRRLLCGRGCDGFEYRLVPLKAASVTIQPEIRSCDSRP